MRAGDMPKERPMTRKTERKLKPSTLMMGYGYDPVLSEGALKPPIFLTSTFAFPSAADGKRHFEGITGKRPGGAEEALVFSSGMSAIATLLLAYCSQGDVIVHSGPLYAATEGFIARTLSRY